MLQGSLYETLPWVTPFWLKINAAFSVCGANDCSQEAWMQSVRTGLQRGLQRKEVCHRDGADAGCSPAAARKKYSAMMAFSFPLRLFPGMAAGRKTQGLVRGYRFSAQSSGRAHSKDVCRHKKARLLGGCSKHGPSFLQPRGKQGG